MKISVVVLLYVGINRNDVYITLERGEYDKGTKTAQKNVEVAVVVVNDSGEIRHVSFVWLDVHSKLCFCLSLTLCVCMCVCTRTHVCICVCCLCICARVCTCVHACVLCVCTHICICVYDVHNIWLCIYNVKWCICFPYRMPLLLQRDYRRYQNIVQLFTTTTTNHVGMRCSKYDTIHDIQ